MNWDPYLISQKLTVKPETRQLFEENVGESSFTLVLAMAPKTKARKSKVNKKDYIKLNSFAQRRKQSTK